MKQTPALRAATARRLADGGHVCLVVEDERDLRAVASDFLTAGAARGDKTVVFGPENSALRARLRPLAAMAADPYADVLGRRGLEPETMLAMFREQAAAASAEGFTGLRVAADMDWLLAAAPAPEDILGFEVMLDRVACELGASVLCAYRRGTFDRDTIVGMLCIHPKCAGQDADPPFKLVWGDGGAWVLSGAVDLRVADQLAAALRGTEGAPWVIDVSELEFIDVAGMRAVATVARAAGSPLEFRGASPFLRRHWALAAFDVVAPAVQFTA